MQKRSFFTISVPKAQEVLPHLHEEVVHHNGRIELFSEDVSGASVIISKLELQCMEKALAILSDSDDVKEMRTMLKKVARSEQRTALKNKM